MTPPESPPEKAGFVDRVLELGNSNKLIAVATLITVATGVPYLVNVVLGAFGGEEPEVAAPPAAPVITQEMLAAAMAESMAQVRAQAERAGAEGPSPAAEDAVAAAGRALEALGEEAASPEATPEERERIMTAYQQHATGNLAAALDEFTRVATEQEERGALEEAAETWRHRGAIQYWVDSAAALEDYRHAEELAPGDAAQTFGLARLYLAQSRHQEAMRAFRQAIRQARDEEDLETLAQALHLLATANVMINEFLRSGSKEEWLYAVDEGIDVLEELLEEAPHRLRLIGMQATLLRMSVAEHQIPERVGGFDDYLHEKIDYVEEVQHPSISAATRNAVLANLHVLHTEVVKVRILDGEETEADRREELLEEYANAMRCAWAVVDASRREARDLADANIAANALLFAYAEELGEQEKALEAVDLGLAVARENARVFGSEIHVSSWMLGRARMLLEMGRTEEGIAQAREGLALMEACIDYFGQPMRGWFQTAIMNVNMVALLPTDETGYAEELFARAQQIADGHLDDVNRGRIESAIREGRESFAARAAGDLGESGS